MEHGKSVPVMLIGATPKKNRYAYIAMKLLISSGFTVYLFHPTRKEIEGIKIYNDLTDINDRIDTVTLYINNRKSQEIESDILRLKPRRIIFNPGAENATLAAQAQQQNIITLNSCTIVMLKTNQF